MITNLVQQPTESRRTRECLGHRVETRPKSRVKSAVTAIIWCHRQKRRQLPGIEPLLSGCECDCSDGANYECEEGPGYNCLNPSSTCYFGKFPMMTLSSETQL